MRKSKLTKTAQRIGAKIGRTEVKARAALKVAQEETRRIEKRLAVLTRDLRRAQQRLRKALT